MRADNGFDVFLSYAHRDEVEAAELNGWLRAQGLRTFFKRSELRPGLRWLPALEDAIGRSGAVAILVGRDGFGNTQQYERELALLRKTRDEGFPVIPVLMPGCKNPPTGFLQLLTWVDLSQDNSVLQQPESLDTLLRAIHGLTVSQSSIRSLVCPYRGLEPFREEDATFFCGRDDAIRDLVAKVQQHSFVAVVGPSGSGKSSLVFAGLLPALRQQRETTWDVISFRPGASPLAALTAAFATVPKKAEPATTDTNIENEAAAFRTGDSGMLGRMVARRLDGMPEKPDRLLIYVDQWEELYSMAPVGRQNSIDVEKFVALLVAAASDQSSRTTVILTIRADFYAALIGQSLVSTLLPVQQFNVPPMSLSDLRSTIVTPAKKLQLSFDSPALVNQILDDAATEEGQLPLLQYALKEMWESREGDRLTTIAYAKEGGVSGAIQRMAELAYSALTPAQQEAARSLFLGKITKGLRCGEHAAINRPASS
jgi:energy-coupling factor transporter ATP-binding protein EcfA2